MHSIFWVMACLISTILGVVGVYFGLYYNPTRISGNRLFDAGVASLFGVLLAGVLPPLGIIAGSLAVIWRNDVIWDA